MAPASRGIAALAILLFWLVSLALPVARLEDGFAIHGYTVLLFGPVAVLGMQVGWLANPLLLLTLAIFAHRFASRKWLACCGAALLLPGASALLWRGWPDMDSEDRLLPLAAFAPGYYLWLALVFGTAAAALWLGIREPEPA